MNKRTGIFVSAILGNVLEYYDFTVYAVFSVVIGELFFSSNSEFIQMLSSLGVFAIGFLTRPIGGIIFGYIADRKGRRTSLIISMLGMTISTFTIGIIPNSKQIGYYAPIILVILRLIQGLCISGEGAGAAIFILEHYKKLKPGLTAAFVHAANIAGTLLATFVGIIFSMLFPNIEYAWRIAFIIGGVMGTIGFYFRLQISETPIFIILEKRKKLLRSPFMHLIRTAKKSLFITICLGGTASSIVYLLKTYINVFYSSVLHLDNTIARAYLAYSSIVMIIALPISGYISDCIGKFKMIIFSTIAILFLVLPCLILISNEQFISNIIGLTILAILAGAISGTAYVFVISLFTPEQKFTGVAFGYNLGVALFGGTSAAISRSLLELTSLYYSPAFYIMFCSGSFLLIIFIMRNYIKLLLNE